MDRDETFTHTHTRIQTQTCYHSVTTTTTFLSPHNRRTYLQITLQPTLIWPFRSSATNTRRRHGTHAGKQRRVKALRCRSRSRRLTPSADTSSPAAVKGFQEVVSVQREGKPHLERSTRSNPALQAQINRARNLLSARTSASDPRIVSPNLVCTAPLLSLAPSTSQRRRESPGDGVSD